MNPTRLPIPAAAALAGVAVLSALVVGASFGVGPGILVLAGGALLGAVSLLWSSLQKLTGESPLTVEEALGMGAPSAEEERKRSVVRALKDLEYERSVGKISEEDYAELSARYRAEAKTLLRALDVELTPHRKEAEERLAARLRQAGVRKADDDAPTRGEETVREPSGPPVGDEAASAPGSTSKAPDVATRTCPACSTQNDPDARFCKQCATSLSAEGSATA